MLLAAVSAGFVVALMLSVRTASALLKGDQASSGSDVSGSVSPVPGNDQASADQPLFVTCGGFF